MIQLISKEYEEQAQTTISAGHIRTSAAYRSAAFHCEHISLIVLLSKMQL